MSTPSASSADADAALKALGSYQTLVLRWAAPAVLNVHLRIGKLNAMSRLFWKEMRDSFTEIGRSPHVRVILLTAEGKIFTAGLDLADHTESFTPNEELDVARRSLRLRTFVREYQESFDVVERVPQPVVAAVHGACIGGGVDLILSADIRMCSADAFFSVKEVDVGMAADVGTLQRLPKLVGNQSLVKEWCLTGRRIPSGEALSAGLVSRVLGSREALLEESLALSVSIASKSPLAVVGTKHLLNFSREHSVAQSHDYIALWNMSALQSGDLLKAMSATMSKTMPIYSNL